MGNGMNKVVDGLYLGNIRDAESRESLSKNGITHILSVYNNAKPVFEDMTYLCIHAADASSQNLLAGVSRSTTMVVAYLMTVTHYNRDECLSAVKAVRTFVGPNDGFQRQLLEYQTTQVSEYRTWLRSSFRPSPFKDEEQVGALLSQYTEQHESQRRGADRRRADRDGRVSALPADSAGPKGSS
ncbi:Dual specificity protein phosphatase 22-A [Liparis tanakae]|uniref:Dual specificity protein phosphatase 22-A n=1 Tax=Liparis tanakae TaxID=230148 RepID=A0A4Z2IAM5_9TELE|nr:Dual specificity protein phosphatase 22-A [Liparis tanakae]